MTLRELFENLPCRLEFHAAGGLGRRVARVGLLAAGSRGEAGEDTLWIHAGESDALRPDIDALILELYRQGAAGLVLPGDALAESARLLARELGFPVALVAPAALDGLVQQLWERVHAHELVVRRQAEEITARLRAAFATAEDTESFLGAAGALLGAQPRLVEVEQDPGPRQPAERRLPIGRGQGGGELALGPAALADEVQELVLPELLLMASVLVDREATRIESDLRLRGELLLELLVDQGAPSGSVIRAAERFGMDLGHEHFVVLWDLDDFAGSIASGRLSEVRILRLKRDIAQSLEELARQALGRAWVLPHSDDFVLVAGGRSGEWQPKRAAELVRGLQAGLAPVLRRYGLKGIAAGLGYPYSGAQGLRKSFEEAREALVVGRAQFGTSSVTHFADLGLHRFLYGWFDTPRSRALAQDFLRPLLEDDEHGHGQLLETLRVYLELRGRASATATRLGVHRNTLRYRLDRIASLLGVDLEATNVQLVLQLILRTLPE